MIVFFVFIISSCKNSDLKEMRKYDEKGTLKTIYFVDKNNILQGSYTTYKNGVKESILNIKDGKVNGEVLDFYSNGKIMEKSKFKNEIKIDTNFYYRENGKLEGYSIYDNSANRIKTVAFYPNGKIKEKRVYISGQKTSFAYIRYNKFGKIDESNSKFCSIKFLNSAKTYLKLKIHYKPNKHINYDSVALKIKPSFHQKNNFDIMRSITFKDANNIKIKLLPSDFVKGKVNFYLLTFAPNSNKNLLNPNDYEMEEFQFQLDKKNMNVMNNVNGILVE